MVDESLKAKEASKENIVKTVEVTKRTTTSMPASTWREEDVAPPPEEWREMMAKVRRGALK
jgi:hypothetical protein